MHEHDGPHVVVHVLPRLSALYARCSFNDCMMPLPINDGCLIETRAEVLRPVVPTMHGQLVSRCRVRREHMANRSSDRGVECILGGKVLAEQFHSETAARHDEREPVVTIRGALDKKGDGGGARKVNEYGQSLIMRPSTTMITKLAGAGSQSPLFLQAYDSL